MGIAVGSSGPAAAQVPFEIVHTLPIDPVRPVRNVPLIEDPDGSLYGITVYGGSFGGGTVFKTTRVGVTTILCSFNAETTGPPFTLARGADDNLYGLTANRSLAASFFRITRDGVLTFLGPKTGTVNGGAPGEPLIGMPDGNFYWFSSSGIWRIGPTGLWTALPASGFFGPRSVVVGEDGQFYLASPGAIARMDPFGRPTILRSFGPGPDGYVPGGLVQATDGNLYGTTLGGGAFNRGTVFRLSTSGAFSTLHSFAAGEDAPSRLFQASDGYLYGLVTAAPSYLPPVASLGTILRVSLDGSVATAHIGTIDFAAPVSLMQASDGTFFGTTESGGETGFGSVFELANDGAVASLTRFSLPEGSFNNTFSRRDDRLAGLIQAMDGRFYGAAVSGGRSNRGTVFAMSRSGTLEVIHHFTGEADGSAPCATLLQARDGNIYGTTSAGGASAGGTVFRITPSGAFAVTHTFLPTVDGSTPLARLLEGSDGNLYGTTSSGGAANSGTVFRITMSGSFEVVHTFTGGSDGGHPEVLLQHADGKLYGTAAAGGDAGRGLVYSLGLDGAFTVLHAFTSSEGSNPVALIQAQDGNLYGTLAGGACSSNRDDSRVFRLTTSGEMTVLHVFQTARDFTCGTFQIVEAGGNFYVTITTGSRDQIYRMNRDGLLSAIVLPPSLIGLNSSLFQADDGNVYGIARSIVVDVFGAIFRFSLLPPPPTSDIRSKLTLFRPSTGTWFFADGTSLSLGAAGDRPVPGDYNGDGIIDVAMFRPSTAVWSIVGVGVTAFGLPGDIPVPADYDGDGKTDLAVFRPSTATWYIAGRDPVVFGVPGDVPVPGDYAGIGRAQIAIARHGSYYVNGQPGPIVVGGRPEDLAVPADYDGDGRLDMAVYRPSTGSWIVRDSATGQRTTTGFGTASDRPAPQDLDGDGRAELVVFRRATGTWFTYNTRTGAGATVRFGVTGDQPIWAPALRAAAPGDVDGDARADLTVYRATTGEWLSPAFPNVRLPVTVPFGAPSLGDIPVAGDYDGDGTMDLAVFRQSTGDWFLAPLSREVPSIQWGIPALGDEPVPADYDGDGVTDVAVYRRTTGEWFIQPSTTGKMIRFGWGQAASTDDLPVALDFDGDGLADFAIYRQTTGEWFIRRSADQGTTYVSGSEATAGALPVPADYDGDGKADVAVFRAATGEWLITRSSTGRLQRLLWGDRASGDIPVPADYDGDGAADVGVYRATTGQWFVLRSSDRQLLQSAWGCPTCGDTPVLQPARP